MKIKAYKGFNGKLQCTPAGKVFQYEVGKQYEEPDADLCETGFHACEYPLDVFSYYPPAGARFAEVELDEVSDQTDGDSKRAGKKIAIKAELSIGQLVKAAVDYTFERSTPEGEKATGTRGAASATGYQGAASATGARGAASATGDYGAASATGDYGAASATGTRGAASATGARGAASATGYQGAASATGTRGAASATGTRGAASATGDYGAAVALGIEGKAKSVLGGFITVSEWAEVDNEWQRIDVKSTKVDGETIKADTYYMLRGGEFVEVE